MTKSTYNMDVAHEELEAFLSSVQAYAHDPKVFDDSCLNYRTDRVEVTMDFNDCPRMYGEGSDTLWVRVPITLSNDDEDRDRSCWFVNTPSGGVISYICDLPPFCDEDGDAYVSDVVWFPFKELARPHVMSAMKANLSTVAKLIKNLRDIASQAEIEFDTTVYDYLMSETFK